MIYKKNKNRYKLSTYWKEFKHTRKFSSSLLRRKSFKGYLIMRRPDIDIRKLTEKEIIIQNSVGNYLDLSKNYL